MHFHRPGSHAQMVVLIFLLSITSCQPIPEPDMNTDDWPDLIQFVSIGRGHHARLDSTDTTVRIITDTADWEVYQDSLQPLMSFDPVDFSTEMLVLVATPVPSEGYDLRIDLVESLNDTMTVTYSLFVPATDCRIADLPGNVFDVVRLNRVDHAVRFVEETESLRCTLR